MTSRSDTSEAGFTLFEMIVVLAVMGLMLAMVMIRGTPVSAATHARAAARAISGTLRAARGEAVMSNRSVVVSVDVGNHSYWVGRRPPEFLPADLNLALLTGQDQTLSDNLGQVRVGQFRFDPDGSSSGGRVAIAGGDKTIWVGIDWLSGRVSIVDKPRQP
jgi:general secretion pathway protein H